MRPYKQTNKQEASIISLLMNLFTNCLASAATLKGLAFIALLTAILSNAIPNKWIEESFRGYSIAHEDRCQWLPGATDTDRTLKGSYILYVKACRAS